MEQQPAATPVQGAVGQQSAASGPVHRATGQQSAAPGPVHRAHGAAEFSRYCPRCRGTAECCIWSGPQSYGAAEFSRYCPRCRGTAECCIWSGPQSYGAAEFSRYCPRCRGTAECCIWSGPQSYGTAKSCLSGCNSGHHTTKRIPVATLGAGATPKRLYRQNVGADTCKKCGQFRTAETGHSQYRGRVFCPQTEILSKELWLEEMRKTFGK
ncbi:hypothetical protein KUCAC02_000803 [Chaenocephalus aceratus]|uniref:Uncharacterized protein n=1 Tax=Chaenocephalus aceratus TaxID=36190 RepID=A0ACB9W863_CHAAC|nr:hypothetical protein KUCAC02_000803 [Chaenocephalus aceratus]